MSGARSGEFAWIARYFAPLAGEGAFGLRDDAALIEAGGPLVLTQDTIVEGIHFFPDDPPGDVAKKAVRVNVSDVVAKGALPDAMLLSLSVPLRWTDADVEAFAIGLGEDLDRYGLRLLGGDTTTSPERLTVSIAMIGRPIADHVSRLGARVGDDIVVSGPIGDASLGLQGRGETFRKRLQVPEVRLEPAHFVASQAHASMDVSDGLVGDLAKLCAASGVGARIDLALMPLSPETIALDLSSDELVTLATGGDDYVVLATVAPGTPLDGWTRIGEIVKGTGVGVTLDGVTLEIRKTSYTHD